MTGVPGRGGRVPKRADQRHGHRTKAEQSSVDAIPAIGNVDPGELLFSDPHPIVQELWDAAQESAQRKFFERSDWALLNLTLYELDRYLRGSKRNGQILAAIYSSLGELLFSEGARRRVRIEIDRETNEEPAPVRDINSMRKRFSGG